jgi:hypothetical protein
MCGFCGAQAMAVRCRLAKIVAGYPVGMAMRTSIFVIALSLAMAMARPRRRVNGWD